MNANRRAPLLTGMLLLAALGATACAGPTSREDPKMEAGASSPALPGSEAGTAEATAPELESMEPLDADPAESPPEDLVRPDDGADSEVPPSWRELPEYRMLASAGAYECAVVGEGGETPLSAVAFTRLVLRSDALDIFLDLLDEKTPAARIYGLHGLWFADRALHAEAARGLAANDTELTVFCGCIVSRESFHAIVDEAPGETWNDWSGPVALFRSGTDWIEDSDPGDDDADSWKTILVDTKASLEDRSQAARVLARSLGGAGLEPLVSSLSTLDDEVRTEALHLLRDAPPWSEGILVTVTRTLENEDRFVELGALHVLDSLARCPWLRDECRALVPRLDTLLSSFVPGTTAEDDERDEAWLSAIATTLADIGGAAGPVLVRAMAHPEARVRDHIALEPWNLDAWGRETIAGFAPLLEHPELEVRRAAVERLLALLESGDEEGSQPLPPDVSAALSELAPAVRKAIGTLDAAERKDLEMQLDGALEGEGEHPQ